MRADHQHSSTRITKRSVFITFDDKICQTELCIRERNHVSDELDSLLAYQERMGREEAELLRELKS